MWRIYLDSPHLSAATPSAPTRTIQRPIEDPVILCNVSEESTHRDDGKGKTWTVLDGRSA